MAHTGEVVDHGTVEIQQEQIRGDGIGQGGAVVALVLVVPVLHGIVVGVGQRDGVDALIHLHIFVGISADGLEAVLPRQIHIGGSHAVFRFAGEAAHHLILPFPGQTAAAAELRKAEGVLAGAEILDLPVQAFLRRSPESGIIVLHAEIDLIDDLQQIDLKLHGGKQRAPDDDVQAATGRQGGLHIIPDRMPQAQKLHIVVFDKADGTQIIQFLFRKAQGAEMVDLGIDLLEHLPGEHHALIAAAEIVLAAQVGMLVEDHLIHIELVQVGIQQRLNDGFQLHGERSLHHGSFFCRIRSHRSGSCAWSPAQLRAFRGSHRRSSSAAPGCPHPDSRP